MIIGIILHVYCGFVICLVIGDESRKCSKFFTEIPVIPMCGADVTVYSFPQDKKLTPIVHMGRSSLTFNVSTSCSCDITIQPLPQRISWRYRSSQLGGCRLLPAIMTESNTLECLTDKLRVNKSLGEETLFHTQTVNNDSYVCFGIGIEDPYVEERSFNVTCSQAETSPIFLDADPNTFNISTTLDVMAPRSGNITDDKLTLTYRTAIIFEKKQYETSTFSVKPSNDKASHGNTNTTSNEDKEAIKTNDAFLTDDKKILNIIIGVSSGGVGVILLVSIVFVYRRANRRKKNVVKPAVRYTVTVQRENNEDLVITDNLVYNIDEDDAHVDVNVDNDDKRHSSNRALVHTIVYTKEDDSTYANHAEVEYTNSMEIGTNKQPDNIEMKPRAIAEGDAHASEQDVLTDDEKMDLYANKFINRNKSMVVDDDQVYSNDDREQS